LERKKSFVVVYQIEALKFNSVDGKGLLRKDRLLIKPNKF
jgi:hypothetical protein